MKSGHNKYLPEEAEKKYQLYNTDFDNFIYQRRNILPRKVMINMWYFQKQQVFKSYKKYSKRKIL